jgi:hypothetical protein
MMDTRSFITCKLWTHTVSFCAIHENELCKSLRKFRYSVKVHRFVPLISQMVKFHSTYPANVHRLIPHIQQRREINLIIRNNLFSWRFLKEHCFEFRVVELSDPKPIRNETFCCSSLTKIILAENITNGLQILILGNRHYILNKLRLWIKGLADSFDYKNQMKNLMQVCPSPF